MTRRRGPVVALLLLLAAVLAVVTWWALREEPEPPVVPAPAPSTVVLPRAPEPPPRTRSPRPVREATQPAETVGEQRPEGAGRSPAPLLQIAVKLTVVVRRSSGGAAQGAIVLALDPLGDLTSPPGPVVRERKTAGDTGRAEFELRGGTNVVRVLAALDGEAALSRSIDVGDGQDRTVELDLRAATTPRVRIVSDTDGAPIAGAWARLQVLEPPDDWPVKLAETADRDGVAAFVPLPLGARAGVLVEAGAKGHLEAARTVRPSAFDAGPVEFRLAPAVSVSGRVVDEQGAAVVNALARVVNRGVRGSHDVSGTDGRFEAQGLPPEGGALWVERAGFAPAIVRDLRGDAGPVHVGDVVLRAGGAVAGIVVGADGQPAKSAAVKVIHEETGVEIGETESGDDGTFRFERMPHERLAVEATEGGRSDWAVALKARADGVMPGGGEVRLVLSGAATVFVRFLNDADRSAVVVTSVKLTASATGATPAAMAWAWSGANIDSVRFQPEHTGVFDVTVEIPGYESGTAKAVEVAPDRETRIDVLFRRR